MFLRGAFLGISFLEKANKLPISSAYTSLNFYGNNIVSDIHVQNRLYSDEEILSLQLNDAPTWDGYTLLLSRFDQLDLQAGNILNMTSPITNWDVYRKDADDKIYKKLTELDADTTEYTDYTVTNKSYTYVIYPKTDNEIGEPLQTIEAKADFSGWFLVDQEEGISYSFDLNLDDVQMSNSTDITTFQGYSKYNAYSFGDRDYITGSIKALGGTINVNGEYVLASDYVDNLRAFINNKKDKILKSRHGDIFNVITKEFSWRYLNDLKQNVVEVSFSFEQSGDS